MQHIKKITVVGSTSDTGKVITGILKAAWHQIAKVSRGSGISMDDQQALNAAFENADDAYLTVPFDMMAADLHFTMGIILS